MKLTQMRFIRTKQQAIVRRDVDRISNSVLPSMYFAIGRTPQIALRRTLLSMALAFLTVSIVSAQIYATDRGTAISQLVMNYCQHVLSFLA